MYKTMFHVSAVLKPVLLSRLNWGCFRCDWREGTSDIHHINGRGIDDPHNHSNLTYLCPNCHRLIHRKKIDMTGIKTVAEVIPENWRELIPYPSEELGFTRCKLTKEKNLEAFISYASRGDDKVKGRLKKEIKNSLRNKGEEVAVIYW